MLGKSPVAAWVHRRQPKRLTSSKATQRRMAPTHPFPWLVMTLMLPPPHGRSERDTAGTGRGRGWRRRGCPGARASAGHRAIGHCRHPSARARARPIPFGRFILVMQVTLAPLMWKLLRTTPRPWLEMGGNGTMPCTQPWSKKGGSIEKKEGFIVVLVLSIWRKPPSATMTAAISPTSKKTTMRRTRVLKTPIQGTYSTKETLQEGGRGRAGPSTLVAGELTREEGQGASGWVPLGALTHSGAIWRTGRVGLTGG